jgi:hypothetical protein
VIDFLNGKILEVTDLVRGASVLGAIVMVAAAYYKARSIVALIVAALTAGVFLWTVNNVDWWQDRVEEETRSRDIWSSVVELQHDVSSELDPVFAEFRTGLETSEAENG